MTWNIIQQASTAATASSSASVAATYGQAGSTPSSGANLSSGSKLIACVGYSGAGITISSVKDGAGNTMTQVAFLANTHSNVSGVGIYAMDTPAGDVGSKPAITATFSSSSTQGSIVIFEVSGLATGNTLAAMIDGGAAATTSFAAAGTYADPAYTTHAAGEFLIAVLADDGGPQSFGQPGAYSLAANSVNNNSNANCCVAYLSSSNGAESGTWTVTGTQTFTELAVAAFLLGAAGGVTPAATMWPVPMLAPAYVPGLPGLPGGTPFAPWPPYDTSGPAPGGADLLAAAATVTAAITATLVNAPAAWELPPQVAPAWFPGAPASPAGEPFQAWPQPQTLAPAPDPYTDSYTDVYGGAETPAFPAFSPPGWLPAAGPGSPGSEPFTPWPQYQAGAAATVPQDVLNAAATVTATAAATLDVSKAPVVPLPQYPPAWFPSAPSAPGADPFTPWPLGLTGVNSAALTAASVITAAAAAALTEAKPVNAATTVTATGAAAETTAKPVNAAQTVTATAAASLDVVKAGSPLAPAWEPYSYPGAPPGQMFQAWPVWEGTSGGVPTPVDFLNAPQTVTATGHAALAEAKPVNAAAVVTATVTASLATAKPVTAAATVTAGRAAAETTAKPLNAAATVTATGAAALADVSGAVAAPSRAPALYAPSWYPGSPGTPAQEPFAPWPPWTGSTAPAPTAPGTLTAATSSATLTAMTTASLSGGDAYASQYAAAYGTPGIPAAALTAATSASTLTAATAGGTLTAATQRTGGPGG